MPASSTTPDQPETNHPDPLSMLSVVNSLEIVTNLSTNFTCKICHNFMIDICTIPCGHKFCKFCGLSWLRLESTCPICHEETYKPFASRCYEMDSVIDDFYPLLYRFYHDLGKTADGKRFVGGVGYQTRTTGHEFDYAESIQELRKQMNGNDASNCGITLRICSPSERGSLRMQRRALSERRDILLAAPCTSILQKLATLGWGTSTTERSISSGMRMMVWVVLCYVFWNFLYTFHHPWFDGGVRTFVYSCLILIAVNLMQMQLFPNPEQGPNLLDFELWEYMSPATDLDDDIGRSNSMGEENRSTDLSNERIITSGDTRSRFQRHEGVLPSSYESFKECDGGDFSASLQELEQIIQWKNEDKLDFERVFKFADVLTEALNCPPNKND